MQFIIEIIRKDHKAGLAPFSITHNNLLAVTESTIIATIHCSDVGYCNNPKSEELNR